VTVDVTQGMKGKITKIAETLSGINVLVFNVNVEGNLYKALAGGKIRATEIRL